VRYSQITLQKICKEERHRLFQVKGFLYFKQVDVIDYLDRFLTPNISLRLKVKCLQELIFYHISRYIGSGNILHIQEIATLKDENKKYETDCQQQTYYNKCC
jgi:hypothetical protein